MSRRKRRPAQTEPTDVEPSAFLDRVDSAPEEWDREWEEWDEADAGGLLPTTADSDDKVGTGDGGVPLVAPRPAAVPDASEPVIDLSGSGGGAFTSRVTLDEANGLSDEGFIIRLVGDEAQSRPTLDGLPTVLSDAAETPTLDRPDNDESEADSDTEPESETQPEADSDTEPESETQPDLLHDEAGAAPAPSVREVGDEADSPVARQRDMLWDGLQERRLVGYDPELSDVVEDTAIDERVLPESDWFLTAIEQSDQITLIESGVANSWRHGLQIMAELVEETRPQACDLEDYTVEEIGQWLHTLEVLRQAIWNEKFSHRGVFIRLPDSERAVSLLLASADELEQDWPAVYEAVRAATAIDTGETDTGETDTGETDTVDDESPEDESPEDGSDTDD